MGRRHLISAHAPEFVAEEAGPRSRVHLFRDGNVSHRLEAHVRGKSLVQPKVVPPFHGDEISEPHVRQLVQICYREAQPLREAGSLTPIQVELIIGDAADVLHRAIVMLGNKDLIIFVEWVFLAE